MGWLPLVLALVRGVILYVFHCVTDVDRPEPDMVTGSGSSLGFGLGASGQVVGNHDTVIPTSRGNYSVVEI